MRAHSTLLAGIAAAAWCHLWLWECASIRSDASDLIYPQAVRHIHVKMRCTIFFSIAHSIPSHASVTISTMFPPSVSVVPVTIMDHNWKLSRSHNWTGSTSSFSQNCVDTSVHLTLSLCTGRLSGRKPFRQDIWPRRKLNCIGRWGCRLPESAVFLCDKLPW
jgi:hypothetical protein